MEESNSLNATERRSVIAEMALSQDMIRVVDLASQFGLTETSIRRDLDILESEGRLRRVHGGAMATARHVRSESYMEKARQRMADKARIGAAAAAWINPGEVLLFDSGTTTLQVIRNIPAQLRGSQTLTLVTNSLPVVDEIRDWTSANLILLGGMYLPDYQATVGPQAVAQLSQLTADKVFLGADGLTMGGGITTAHILMAEMDRAMAERARKVILLTDSSKLGPAGFVPIIPVNRIHVVVTDTDAPPAIVAELRSEGVEVHLV
jgi:DeoR family transcriptional regulator, aga operon transcriptional repressor